MDIRKIRNASFYGYGHCATCGSRFQYDTIIYVIERDTHDRDPICTSCAEANQETLRLRGARYAAQLRQQAEELETLLDIEPIELLVLEARA